jgi:hypothetical protein
MIIDTLRLAIANGQQVKYQKVSVDLFSASAIVQVYDALNDANKAKYASLPIRKMADIAFKIGR